MSERARVSAAEWKQALFADLMAPPQESDPKGLAARWSYKSIRFVCVRPPLLEDYPEFSVRVRGAWGRELANRGPVVRRGVTLPAPFEILFAPLGRWASGLEIAKPAIVRAQVDGEDVIVDLHLFGWADVYLDEAASALADALEGGLSLGLGVRQRVPLPIRQAGEQSCEGLVSLASPRSISLLFRTPAVVRKHGALLHNPTALMRSLLLRASALARWQGVQLVADWAWLHQKVDQLSFDDNALIATAWRRYSQRQGATAIPMRGLVGRLNLAGPLEALAPFVAIGETCNTGSHAALGLGWYEAAYYP